MTQRIARLLLDPGRIGIRDADEDDVRACGGATKVLQMSVVERLEAPVNHAGGHWSLVLARNSKWRSRSQRIGQRAETDARAKPVRPEDDIASDVVAHSTTTPTPSSTLPMRRMKSLRALNSASSVGPRSAGSETSKPPAVCGS